MINGLVVGTILENADPSKMHRVLVRYPVDSGEELKSSWCRMVSPMAGKDRGLVMLPDIGTEVVLGFAYRSMSPYVLGAVYNGGEDKPKSYANDDGDNNKRVFWSRNDHMVIFDDTDGAEKVELGAQASGERDVTSAPIYQTLDSSEKIITMFCEKNTEVESLETISVKCKDFILEVDKTVSISAGSSAVCAAGSSATIDSSGTQTYKGGRIDINPSAPPAAPETALPTPPHSHPPTS
jgi:uncharacterized protein involved in type VI secretion and phage assembly